MTDYERMSREELIARLRRLENRGATSVVEPSSGKSPREESALRDSEERLRAIVQTAAEGIITFDERGVIESVNPAAERMFGYSHDELAGHNVTILISSIFHQDQDWWIQNYAKMGRSKITAPEMLGRRKDGSVFPMDLSVGEVRLADRRLFTSILRDITERKRAENRLAELAENLAEKNREIETVVYLASHDLRSPLVNIQGFSRELEHACATIREKLTSTEWSNLHDTELRAILNEEIPEAIDYILASVNKIDTLLKGFLRFSRLGRASMRIRHIDMNAILAETIQTMDYEIKEAGATIDINQLPDCYADPTQIGQVIANLLSNALKYRAPNKVPAITVSGTVADDRSIYRVEDNGIGIAPEHQGKIFEIFHRLDPKFGGGEGLGLAIAQRILERHHGKIWVESEPGRGSAFFISLPRAHPGNSV